MLLNKLASVFAQRKGTSSPIYESVSSMRRQKAALQERGQGHVDQKALEDVSPRRRERCVDECRRLPRPVDLDTDSMHSADDSGALDLDAMSRVDSGHETLVDDDSPTPTPTLAASTASSSRSGVISTSTPCRNGGPTSSSRASAGPASLSSTTALTPSRTGVTGASAGSSSVPVDLNTTLPSEQHVYEEVRNRACREPSAPPPKLPSISGVLQNKGPVIRPIACRPTPPHTPATTPTLFHSMERPARRANHHYGSALELKTSGSAAPSGEKRSNSSMARSRYESLDSLRPGGGGGGGVEPYSSPAALIDEYRAYRAAVRPVDASAAQPRRESFSGRVESRLVPATPDSRRQGVSGGGDSRRQGLARHDSLRSLTGSLSGGAGSGGGASVSNNARIGGSVSNLTSTEAAGGAGLQHAAAGRRRSPASLQSTPSPSDSGVAELEPVARDAEIGRIRQNMEQLHSDSERTWEKELRKIQGVYDSRLKASQQRALKMEQMLTMQTYQLQQEKRKLRQEMDEIRREKEQASRQNDELRKELTQLRSQLEDTEWGLCQKTGEISLLKSQLKDSQGDQTTRGHQMLHIRSQIREYVTRLDHKQAENQRLHTELNALRSQAHKARPEETNVVIGQLQREIERLKADLSQSRQQAQTQKENFEEERLHWLDEKQKVVNYQKQLQLNYMEMYKRNKSLEAGIVNKENTLNAANSTRKVNNMVDNKLNSSGDSQC